MENKIKVSVFCATFNHEKYIRNALDGFVMQKTNFAFEVLVHDDASTDNTASIVREYEEKYPDIIKPIYQTENQYSKGIKISREILAPIAKGEYFAWCEGDDYWTDPYKLQKQVDFLDKSQEYSACAHHVKIKSIITKTESVKPGFNKDYDFSVEEVISCGAPVIHTSSFMIRAKLYLDMPECFKAKGFGDLQLCIYSVIVGKFRVLKDIMSVYNHGTTGSWTDRMLKADKENVAHANEKIQLYNRINKFYDYKYNKQLQYAIGREEFNIYLFTNNKKMMRLPKYRKYLWKVNKSRLLGFVNKYCKWAYNLGKVVQHGRRETKHDK